MSEEAHLSRGNGEDRRKQEEEPLMAPPQHRGDDRTLYEYVDQQVTGVEPRPVPKKSCSADLRKKFAVAASGCSLDP
jgi:hypothetical protein